MNKVHSKYTVTDKLVTQITGVIAGLIVIVLLVWGGWTIWRLFEYEETNDAQVQEYINPVIARVGGFITEVKYDENQEVKKGDTLLLIDDREYIIQQQQTEAALLNAEAKLLVIKNKIKTLEKMSQVNDSKIAEAKANLWKQELDYERYQKLFEVESATQQQLEDEKATLDIAKAKYQSAQDNYQASLSEVDDEKAQLAVVNAEIKRLQALLNRHKLDVSYTIVTAAYNGKMGRRTIEKGQMIDPGQTLAYIVNGETDKWVVANYKETQIKGMYIGESAEVEADAYPGRKFMGKIISISPATGSSFSLLPPDNSTGNYVKIVQRVPVRIKLTGDKTETDLLKAGMNVNVTIAKERAKS